MPIYSNIGGGQSQFPSLLTNINGSSKNVDSAYANISGTSKQIFQSYVLLSNISAGSIVQFNTTLSGTNQPTEFIVLGESNAKNTILLLQKYLYGNKVLLNSTTDSEYSTSDIDKYLSADAAESNSYRSVLPENIRKCLVKTTVNSYSYNYNTMLHLSKDIFLMSATELGYFEDASSEWQEQASNIKDEGHSYYNILKKVTGYTNFKARSAVYFKPHYDGKWWTRSPADATHVCSPDSTYGGIFQGAPNNEQSPKYVRPILSFDPATLVDTTTTIPTIVGK